MANRRSLYDHAAHNDQLNVRKEVCQHSEIILRIIDLLKKEKRKRDL